MNEVRMLPSFVVIGGMKCGTTALWRYLKNHPEIFLPPKIKNIEFFDKRDNWDKGQDWYQSFFNVNSNTIRAVGEVSTEYAKYPDAIDVPANMASLIPDAKLIYLVRDPIERIKSHYNHMVGAAEESRDINDALRDISGNPYIDYSRYYYQLERFLPYYPKDRILIVLSEELKNNRHVVLRSIFSFIGVNSATETNMEIRANLGSERRRWNRLGAYVRRSNKAYNNYIYYKKKYPHVMRIAENMLSKPAMPPIVDPGVREKIILDLQDDMQKLEETFSLDLSLWRL